MTYRQNSKWYEVVFAGRDTVPSLGVMLLHGVGHRSALHVTITDIFNTYNHLCFY